MELRRGRGKRWSSNDGRGKRWSSDDGRSMSDRRQCFWLPHRVQSAAEELLSFSFHQKTTDAFTNLVTLGAKSKLMSLMQVSLSCFLIMSSLLHQATTGASLLHQTTTGASLLHQASTGASLMQRIQIRNMAEKVPSFKTGRSKQCNIRYPAGRSAKAYKECGTGLGSYFLNRIPRRTGPPCPVRRQTHSGPGRDGRTELTSLLTWQLLLVNV
ncbi:hypothetical protein F2Q69_00055155 [Brassica cretica]|uniref:Uncharacterized protein n=1 Tax=Brassica cretica TaxID=69181 RepID=A0A8S9N8L9_BRACR|nr:hypothetical protein F2Q69_00055155 [Brassica cretica]